MSLFKKRFFYSKDIKRQSSKKTYDNIFIVIMYVMRRGGYRRMVVENFILSKEIEGLEVVYNYSVIQSIYCNKLAYGINIKRLDYYKGKEIKCTMDEVKLVSPQKEKVINLAKLLYKEQVSPIHLVDIIGEQVDEWVKDFDEQDDYLNSNIV